MPATLLVHDAYPTELEVMAYLESAGYTLGNAILTQLPGAAAGAAEDFERDTGFTPFLADTADSVRTFDPPDGSGLLEIDGLAASPTSVVYAPTNSDPETLTELSDYWLLPVNALARNRPITQIRLFRPLFNWRGLPGYQQSIQITGRWGYAAALPEDVFQAILAKAAARIWGRVNRAAGGNVKSWTGYGFSKTFLSGDDLRLDLTGWESEYAEVVARYRRLTF